MTTVAFITLVIITLIIILRHTKHPPIHRRKPPKPVSPHMPKPAWVRREIIRIKAHAHESGCRAVADIFNRHFAAEKGITVGKSYVACILRNHSAEIINLRHKWKHRIPKPVPQNLVWAMDLTGITDSAQKTRNILGIIDHGTRKCLGLKALGDKASISLLRILILAIETYGKPKVIRTDDGSVQAMPGYSPGILERG